MPPPLPTLTPEHVAQIAQARAASAKIRRCASVATVGGWVTAVFAGITFLTSLFSIVGLLLGVGMAVVSFFEFRGARDIRKLMLTAPRRLAINQILFGLLLMSYAGIMLWQSLHTPSELTQELQRNPEVAKMFPGLDDFTSSIYVAVYGSVIAAALIGPGLTAVYYHSCRRHLLNYLHHTPPWILDLQRAGMQI